MEQWRKSWQQRKLCAARRERKDKASPAKKTCLGRIRRDYLDAQLLHPQSKRETKERRLEHSTWQDYVGRHKIMCPPSSKWEKRLAIHWGRWGAWAEGSVARGLKTEMAIKTDNWKWSSRFDSPCQDFLAPNCPMATINRMVLRHLDTLLGLLGT